jgi:hypothetical protein
VKTRTYLLAGTTAVLLGVGITSTGHANSRQPAGASSPGIGGAGAFIPPAHANGVFGAGGPLAGIGGAGAFIPPAHTNGVFGAGGPLAGIGGAGSFIPGPQPSTDPAPG